jgi:hypothetical protein
MSYRNPHSYRQDAQNGQDGHQLRGLHLEVMAASQVRNDRNAITPDYRDHTESSNSDCIVNLDSVGSTCSGRDKSV